MDARRFYAIASSLANTIGGPEHYRTSISRSYYAAYNVAVAFLFSLGIRPRSGPSGHSAVANGLLNCQDARMVSAGSDLGTLHQNRLAADYDMSNPMAESQQNAQSMVVVAGNIIVELDKCLLDGNRRSQVERAIKKWVRNTPGCNLQII